MKYERIETKYVWQERVSFQFKGDVLKGVRHVD